MALAEVAALQQVSADASDAASADPLEDPKQFFSNVLQTIDDDYPYQCKCIAEKKKAGKKKEMRNGALVEVENAAGEEEQLVVGHCAGDVTEICVPIQFAGSFGLVLTLLLLS